jgi:hypothetical protein
MVKLQQIKRANGSVVHSINLPLEHIEAIGWSKGEELEFERIEIESGVFILMVFKVDDSAKVRRFLNEQI